MGLIVNTEHEFQNGITINSYYACISYFTYNKDIKKLEVVFNIYKNKESKLYGKQPIMDIFNYMVIDISPDELLNIDIFKTIYEKAKEELFKNSEDLI
jgi:hypothetical protein